MAEIVFCQACGRLSRAEFCSSACAKRGPRVCAACTNILTRHGHEVPARFRIRQTCGEVCRQMLLRRISLASWQEPRSRARKIRGMSLAFEDPVTLETRRVNMKRQWANGVLTGCHGFAKQFSDDEIRALRSDARNNAQLARHHEVNVQVIRRIRIGMTYKHVT